MVERDPWAPTRRFFEALNELREAESLHLEGCYLPGDHGGDCRLCAACEGDPEALDLHVCGRETFA